MRCYLKLNGGAKALVRSKLVGLLNFPLTNLDCGTVWLGGWRTQPAYPLAVALGETKRHVQRSHY